VIQKGTRGARHPRAITMFIQMHKKVLLENHTRYLCSIVKVIYEYVYLVLKKPNASAKDCMFKS
jgi:hypothetical protein